jgi:hypothetical protein
METYLPVLWEDEYCLVEIVSTENKSFIKKQASDIEDFSKKNFDGYGFKDMFVLGEMPAPTVSLELRVDAFEILLNRHRIPKAKQIQYGKGEKLDYEKSISKAHGFPQCTIFFNTVDAGEFINRIWFDIIPGISMEQLNLFQNLLYDLGKSYEFILVDWNSLELVELRDWVQVKNYLKNFLVR